MAQQIPPKHKYQNTFCIIHDDEFQNIDPEQNSNCIGSDSIEWNDSWKSEPNEVFEHQIRNTNCAEINEADEI